MDTNETNRPDSGGRPEPERVQPVTPGDKGPAQQKETVREIHHHHYGRRGWFFPRLFWGLFVIFIGCILLAQGLGLISGFDWGNFFSKIWPVFIVFAGLSIISRGSWVSGLIATVAALAIFAVLFFVFFGPNATRTDNPVRTSSFDISLEPNVTSGGVSISSGAGEVNITSGSSRFVSGTLESNMTELVTSNRVNGTTQSVDIETRGSFNGFAGRNSNKLSVQMSTATPVTLAVNSGASEVRADLTDIPVTSAAFNIGASSLHVVIGDKATSSSYTIKSGASSIDVTLPRSVGARITASTGLSSRNFADFTQRDSNTYVSNNYDSAASKVDLNFSTGASSINVSWR